MDELGTAFADRRARRYAQTRREERQQAQTWQKQREVRETPPNQGLLMFFFKHLLLNIGSIGASYPINI